MCILEVSFGLTIDGWFGYFSNAGLKSTDEVVFASTPAVPASVVLKLGPSKPPRLTGGGDRNTVSISYIDAGCSSSAKAETGGNTATQASHRVQIHGEPSLEKQQDAGDSHLDGTEGTTQSGDKTEDGSNGTPVPVRSEVSCDDIWADDTPCTIRKKVSKPTRLASAQRNINLTFTPKPPDTKARRKSTGSVAATPELPSVGLLDTTPESLKHYASMNRLGFRTPGVDKSLFTVAHGDSVLKSPERQEIDKMIQWIDNVFPPDLSYSG